MAQHNDEETNEGMQQPYTMTGYNVEMEMQHDDMATRWTKQAAGSRHHDERQRCITM
jgi:hypothetical protein